MNIIQMHLDNFGIYHDISWNPPERGLVVMHGQNESGKTTLMKYVRSMFFGYQRGDWKGYFGHMIIRRQDGHEYTIFRNEKESYIEDGDTKILEEPSELWWHGLDRLTYDKIFAMGLEDLQGFKILSNEAVRSHFFSIEGGVRLGMVRHDLSRRMSDLLVASPQGKKPINALLAGQREYDKRIRNMAYDEDEFADLQKKEQTTHEVENRLRLSVEETKQQIEAVSMPIAAWDVYRRGQDAMKHMQQLADVAQFPADGAQKWADLDGKLQEIDKQIKVLEQATRQGPAFKEEWNRWLLCGDDFDALYSHLTEWKQGIAELKNHEDKEVDWQYDVNCHAQALKQWTGDIVPEAVDWSRGLVLADQSNRNEQDMEKWKAAKPKNVTTASEEPPEEEKALDDWEALGKSVAKIQTTVLDRQKVQEQLQWMKKEPADTSKAFVFLGIVLLAAAAGSLAAMSLYDLDSAVAIMAAVVCLAGAAFAFMKHHSATQRVPKRLAELKAELAGIEDTMIELAKEAKLDVTISDSNDVWNQKLDEIRKGYLDWKTMQTKTAWQKEQKVMYDAIYDSWQKEGVDVQKRLDTGHAAWEGWLVQTGLGKLTRDEIRQAKDEWDQWKAVSTTLSQWMTRKADLSRQLSRWHDKAEQIFREVGVREQVLPASVEKVYKQWQGIRVQAAAAKEQDRQQEERKAQLAALRKDREIRRNQQNELLAATGSQTDGEFRSKVLKFRQFQQYKEVYDQSEDHIRLIAKTPKNLAALRHELKIHTLKNWKDELAYYERKIADSEKKLAEVAEKRGSIVERLSQMAKNEEYSQLLQEKQNHRAELDGKVDEWLTCLFAQEMLGQAQGYYERVRQPLVIRTASDYLHLMTQGRYTLQASFDGKELYAVDGTQRRIPEKQWSSGLGDQIYLAIRISLAMAFSKQIEPMPLILDDILVRFDEERQKQAIRFLAELGKTEQVFLFTCSTQTRDIAKAVQQDQQGEVDTIHLFEIEQGNIKMA